MQMKPWHEQDAFWETMASKMFSPAAWQQAATEINQILSLASAPVGAKVLDLCCGPGRHSLELARRGFIVTAVDRTKLYLEKARAKALEEGLDSLTFVLGDMRTFRESESFDLVLNLFTSFGYFKDQSEDRHVMRNIYDSLRIGGKLVLDVLGKEVLAAKFRLHDWTEEDGVLFLEDRVLSDSWSWIETRWIQISGAKRTEFTLSHRLYSATELSSLALEAGFTNIQVYGSLLGVPYDHEANRLILLAVK
jgi:SAM-dependent methyltransferase